MEGHKRWEKGMIERGKTKEGSERKRVVKWLHKKTFITLKSVDLRWLD